MKIKKTVKTTTNTNAKSKAKAQPTVAASASKTPAAKAAPATTGEASLRNGANTGKSTGIRVMLFQDMTLATNDELKRPAPLAHIPGRLTDTELAKVWREEFPNSRAVQAGRINEDIVRGVRNLYNQGTQGHGTPGKTFQSKPWIVVDGKRVQSEYTRARKVKAEGAEAKSTAPKGVKVSAEASEAQTKAAAKKAARVVVAAKAKEVRKDVSRRARAS